MALVYEKINTQTITDLMDPVQMIDWCMRMGLIADKYVCPLCGENMILKMCSLVNKKYMWRCVNNGHDVKRSVRRGSWFDKSKLSMNQILKLTYFWCLKLENESIMTDMDVSSETVNNWQHFCRDVCMELCVRENEMLGGDRVIVEVNESEFGSQKYEKERYVEGKWVFGGVERGTNKCFFAVASTRNKECLLNVIKENVRPGSIIVSDCWRAYDCLEDERFRHLQVNNKYNFVDPTTVAHTSSIEGTWSAIKRDLGSNRILNQFDSYFYEYMWRRKYRENRKKLINIFLESVKEIYVPKTCDN